MTKHLNPSPVKGNGWLSLSENQPHPRMSEVSVWPAGAITSGNLLAPEHRHGQVSSKPHTVALTVFMHPTRAAAEYVRNTPGGVCQLKECTPENCTAPKCACTEKCFD